MASYNYEKHLKAAVESCLSQTHKNIELLIADNSTDNSMKILEEYKKDKRVKIYYRATPWRIAEKLNFLISKVEGEYIKTCWSDDVMASDSIEKNLKFAKQYGLDFVKSDYSYIDYDGKLIKKHHLRYVYKTNKNLIVKTDVNRIIKFGEDCPPMIESITLFAKKEVIERVGGWDERFLLEDILFSYRTNCYDFKIGFLNEPLYYYRVFEKLNINPVYAQRAIEYFSMRIQCMKIAIESGKLDKESIIIAKKRIAAYKAEIFQSKYKYLGLIWLFYKRYNPLLVKQVFRNKNVSSKRLLIYNCLLFVIRDIRKRIKLLVKGIRNPQTWY
ncbi:MAG: glycosyltransferase family 2 protein [Promethearchaeota archaeon]